MKYYIINNSSGGGDGTRDLLEGPNAAFTHAEFMVHIETKMEAGSVYYLHDDPSLYPDIKIIGRKTFISKIMDMIKRWCKCQG